MSGLRFQNYLYNFEAYGKPVNKYEYNELVVFLDNISNSNI